MKNILVVFKDTFGGLSIFLLLSMFSVFQAANFICHVSTNATHQDMNCKVINAGVGGNSSSDLLKRVDDVVALNPDLVILMVGTNDMLNSKKMISFSAYKMNLRSIVEKLSESGTKVLLISPPTADSVYLFERHPRSAFAMPPNEKLDTLSDIVRDVSLEQDLHFLNLFEIFKSKNIPVHEQDEFLRNIKNSGVKDGVHPTEKGYQLIADSVCNFLKENDLLQNIDTIVCFGDSITKGGQKNAKTSLSSASYPSLLEERINNDGN